MVENIKKSKDWRFLITRDLPLVRYCMIVESYAEETFKQWGWQYSGGIVVSKKGIIDIYRQDKFLLNGANYFIKLKNKKLYLRKLLKKSHTASKEINRKINFIKGKLSQRLNKEELTSLFKLIYGEFKKFWTVQNFTFTLNACFNKIGKAEYLNDYSFLLMEMRKLTQDETVEAEELIDLVVEHIAKKIGADEVLLKNSTPREISEGKVNLEEARKRADNYLLIAQGENIKVFTSKKIIKDWEDYLKKLNNPKKELNIKKITGKSTYPGVVKGKVKIVISKKDLKNIRKGKVLVTPMTEMDYVPFLKNVSAIVTDEGGITCHAAIISRELKKPCIIGTKIATRVLKDGDLVEVNANQGIVRIIKASER